MIDADVLQRRAAAGLQIAGDRIEIGAPPAFADRFDHLDRGNCVELLGGLAVVLQSDVDAAGQPGLGDLGVGPRFLLLGQGQADDADAALRRLDRQAAPAAADVEQALAGLQVEAVEEEGELAALGGLEIPFALIGDRPSPGPSRKREGEVKRAEQ